MEALTRKTEVKKDFHIFLSFLLYFLTFISYKRVERRETTEKLFLLTRKRKGNYVGEKKIKQKAENRVEKE